MSEGTFSDISGIYFLFLVYTTKEGDDDLGVKVGVPIGLSILWLLILAFTVGYLKRYWLQKMMKSSTVEPDNNPSTKMADMMPA